ncbi:MAG: hypothetical protein LC659_09470, partial [Myxococcales bacterium]|nr:hypothetical protein [Myxococcales bacterium]
MRRADDATVHVELQATPRRDGQRLTGADVIIDELVAASATGRFVLPSPAHLRLFGTFAAPCVDGEAAGLVAHLRGRSTAGAFIADASVEVADLSSLGSPRLGGRVRATAHLVKGAELRLDADVHAAGLRLAKARIQALDAHVHAIDLAGAAQVTAAGIAAPGLAVDTLVLEAKSDTDRLSATVRGTAAAQRTVALALDGRYLRRDARLIGAELTLRELSVATGGQTWALAQPALVRIDSSLTVERLLLASMGQSIGVDGKYRFANRAIDLELGVHELEPAAFAKIIGVKDALSLTTIDGRVHVGGSVAAPLLRASLKASSDKRVEWYGLSFNTFSLEAAGSREGLLLHVSGSGSGSGRFALDAHGTALWNGDRLVGAEATLDRLRLSANDHVWQTGAPCRLRFDRAATVEKCRLVAGKEEITLDGRVPFVDGPMDATLLTHGLDLRELGAFLAPGHKEPPSTNFNLRVHAFGTRQAPLVDLELRGRGSQVDEGLPENVDYRVDAHYRGGRVDGELSAHQLGTKLGVHARFDLPTSFAQADDRPLAFELEARPVPFFKIRDSLPPAIAGLRGFFTLTVHASGTTRHPIFDAELHAPSWDLDEQANNDTVVTVTYDGARLRANSVTSFASTSFVQSVLRIHPSRNTNAMKLELEAPLDLGQLLSKPRQMLTALVHSAELHATAEIKAVELERVPLQMIGVASPFTSGRVDGALSMTGTLDAPSLHAHLAGTGLKKPGLFDEVDVDASFAFERSRAQLSGSLDVRKHRALTWKADADLDAKKLFDGDQWRSGAVRGELEVPRFPLVALRGMEPRLSRISGTLSGKGALRGTLADPQLVVDLSASELELGGDPIGHAHVEASYRDRRYRVRGQATQAHGGNVHADASWSRDKDAPFSLSLKAQRLDIGFLASASEELSSLGGELDAALTVGGTPAAPTPNGFLSIHHASVGLRGKSETYRNGAFELRTSSGRANLTLDVETRDGALHASGAARVDGVQPTRL